MTTPEDLPDVGKVAIVPISRLKSVRKKPSLKGQTLKLGSLPKSKTLKKVSTPLTQLGLMFDTVRYPILLQPTSNVSDLKTAILGITALAQKIKSNDFDILENLGDETYEIVEDSTQISNILKQDLWIRSKKPKLQVPSIQVDTIQEELIPSDVQKLTGMQEVFESPEISKKLNPEEGLKTEAQPSSMASASTSKSALSLY